jgi:hypothetical protein
MHLMKKLLFIILTVFFVTGLSAQKLKQLSDYQAKLPQYNDWLEEQGLDQVLEFYEIEIENDTLEIYMAFAEEKTSWAISAWQEMKNGFEKMKRYSFEEYLFFNTMAIFKAPITQSNIRIYNSFKTGRQCYSIGIWFDTKDSSVVHEEKNPCKAMMEDIQVDLEDLKNIKNVEIDLDNEKISRENVYKKVLNMARNYYKKKVPDFENDFFCDYSIHETVLEFEVKNLRKEILYEDDDWICGAIKWLYKDFNCDLRKKEYIRVKVEYKNSGNSAIINCTVDGRYASSSTNRMIWDRCNPMEPEFEQYVTRYAKKLKKMIQNELGL